MKNTIMKTLFVIFLILISSLRTIAQNKASGFYRGLITQNAGGLAEKYVMELNITFKPEGDIIGTSFFKLPDSEEIFVKYSFTGSSDGDTITLLEKTIDEEQNREGYYFCLKKMNIKLIKQGYEYFMEGSWSSSNCPDAHGVIKLKKEEIF
jgi:hypothetical protein